MQIRHLVKLSLCFPVFVVTFLTVTSTLYAAAARSVRVLVWDEQQPEQKRAYGDKFLGETIAAHLGAQPGFTVSNASLDSPSQGLDEATLNDADVVIWWSHVKNPFVTDENVERLVSRVREGKLGFIALHSAHWARPFVRLMQERAKDDALAQIPAAERVTAKFEYFNQNPLGKVPPRNAPLTPVLRHEDGVWKLTLPGCIFPAYRGDGAPSHVTTLLPEHPIAAGLPLKWDVAQTEMYDEPFHVPKPDAVVFEEHWDKGENFRSGCLWQVGKGRVFYFRPGHETFPVFKQAEPLRVVENAARWLGASAAQVTVPRVERLPDNPIVRPNMLPERDGENINGPSLIRVPAWVKNPLGRYYLYFAHHNGKHIRLAYADRLEGPWKIHAPGVLHLTNAPGCRGHIASPDVIVDEERREIRMYFHGPARAANGQKSFLALSSDGLTFQARDEVLGLFYFRVFQHGDWWYAMAKGGVLYRSKDGLTRFELGPNAFPGGELRTGDLNEPGPRHVALLPEDGALWIYYSNIGDAPERIRRARLALTPDWRQWKVTASEEVLRPERDWEGATLPVTVSRSGAVKGRENALRDPGIFLDTDGRRYLLYSVAGESGIAIAELK